MKLKEIEDIATLENRVDRLDAKIDRLDDKVDKLMGELQIAIRELRLEFREQIQRIRLAVWLPVIAALGQILFLIFHK